MSYEKQIGISSLRYFKGFSEQEEFDIFFVMSGKRKDGSSWKMEFS